MKFNLGNETVDSVELKCLVVSRGVKIDKDIYQKLGKDYRIYPNALCCNCFKLPDDTIVMATDLGFHLSTLSSMFSWDNLKLFRYMKDMTTDFRIGFANQVPTLFYKNKEVTPIRLMPGTDFYTRRTSSGMPYAGNAVLQGCDWVAFQCLWPCEYAQAGKACQYCFSGGQFEALAKRNKPMPFIPSPQDVAEVVRSAVAHDGVNSLQITGGSTFQSEVEYQYIRSYMKAIERDLLKGEILLYITPPEKKEIIDEYFEMGADRIACSLEVWDDALAAEITPGKREFTTKQRHLDALSYIAKTYGPGKAFSNFIIGLEPLDSLREGAEFLARQGIIPSASVWMPFGKPVRGSMKPASLAYFRAVKEMLGELYVKYNLTPAGNCGLNVCVERDIWKWAHSSESPFSTEAKKCCDDPQCCCNTGDCCGDDADCCCRDESSDHACSCCTDGSSGHNDDCCTDSSSDYNDCCCTDSSSDHTEGRCTDGSSGHNDGSGSHEHYADCLLCGAKLVYTDSSTDQICSICGKHFKSNVHCLNGHYVCDHCHSFKAMAPVAAYLQSSTEKDPLKLLDTVMELPSVHMHGPEHHSIVPLVLLTSARNCNLDFDYLSAVDEACTRGSQVPGGTCGFWGVCGAAAGAGIYASILLKGSPLSTEEWSKSQYLVSDCLQTLAKIGGPRCCKRTSRLAITEAVRFTEQEFQVRIPLSSVNCRYPGENHECIGTRCPYFTEEA